MSQKDQKKHGFFKELKSYAIISFGVVVVALGIHLFEFPNNFSVGGVSGLATVVSALVPTLSRGTFVTIINVALLILGYLVFGKGFAFKTVWVSLLMSGLLTAFEWLIPLKAPMTQQPLMELIFGILLVGAGSAILFSERASSGGTDIIAMILKKYTQLDIGKALFVTDAIIAIAAGFVFDVETAMFSMLGLLARALVVDNLIDSIYLSKQLSIVTDQGELLVKFITETLDRGATMVDCEGTYSRTKKKMVITVLNRTQAAQLKDYVKETDPNAFIITNNTSDILGKGFRENVG